jgi:phosphohistidine phosphatase
LASDNYEKILLILRHAKSSWKIGDYLPDHDRPLNKRGNNQGVKMGKLIKELNLVPDYIISSTAKRAIDTSKLIVDTCGYNGAIDLDASLYHQTTAEQFIKILGNLPDKYMTVLLIGHNPSLEYLIKKLTNRVEVMKTCSLARIDLRIRIWKDIADGENMEGSLVGIWRPPVKESS